MANAFSEDKITGITWRILFLLLCAGCAPVSSSPLPTRPSATCDVRMVEHNRRACVERGKVFEIPGVSAPCGVCR